MMNAPSQTENPTGYHARYEIKKADGTPCDPSAVYFVLRLDSGGGDHHHIAACRAAMRAYIESATGGPLDDLALDLEGLLDEQSPISVEDNPFPIPVSWPDGLVANTHYQVPCDDTGRNGGSWLRMLVANDGDCFPSMQQWEEIPGSKPSPFPAIRIRTLAGGGRNARTRTALLWLAQAMRLDAQESAISDP